MAATHFHPRSHAIFESGAFAPVAGDGSTAQTATSPTSSNRAAVNQADAAQTATTETTGHEVVRSVAARRSLALVRIAFGLTFLWAFFDKLLALGFSTGKADNGSVDRFGPAAWIHGSSPTKGFLAFGADGPFKGFYNGIAGAVWVDWLFMAALLGIGLALTLGIGMRVAGVAGVALYLMMWSVALPPTTNPVIDDHILGALTIVALVLTFAGDTWGLGKAWARTALVGRFGWLR